ncbi:MAG: FAD-dependent monooxygenase [Pseudonocardia sp.]|nr:FAD-dependent monooxygenase [Pseudonocardia sp.]
MTVLDRLPGPSPYPKANGVVGQAARLLRHRGLPERLGHTDASPPASVFQFGGLGLDLTAAPQAPLHGVAASQQELERALGERAAELGVRVRRSCEVVGPNVR